MFMLICLIIGCTTQSTDEGGDSIFPVPPVEPEERTIPSEPVVIQPQPEPQPEPIVDKPEPEPVAPHDGARDLVAPKLVESTIKSGATGIDVNINAVTLTFDEKIAKSDIKIIDAHNQNLRWKRIIDDKNVVLTALADARKLVLDRQYSIVGSVEDAEGNQRVVFITFTTGVNELGDDIEDREDDIAPRFIRTTVNNGDKDVNPDTDHFIFTFDEEIGATRLNIRIEGALNHLGWTHLIRGKEIVLHKLDRGGSLRAEQTYVIQLAWADKAGNWDPGGVIKFTTRVKE